MQDKTIINLLSSMIPATFDLLYEQLLLGSGNLFKYPYALLIQGLFVAVATWYYIHRRAAAAAAEPVRLTKEVIITLSSSYHLIILSS